MRKPDFLRPKICNEEIDKDYKLKSLIFIGSIFLASIVITNVIGVKVMTLFGLNFTAGVVTYGIVFLCTDVIGEIWGKRTAYFFVLLGLLANLLLVGFVYLAIKANAAGFWKPNDDAYADILGRIFPFVIASMVAYLLSQLHDVWAFDFWYRKTGGKWLAVRNNLSTITSQLLDTVVFVCLAFPQFSLDEKLNMIIGQILIKWGIAVIDTPFILLTIKLIGTPVKGAHKPSE